ncbi:hypothetical protein ACGGYM_002411 [Salmonella enterica]
MPFATLRQITVMMGLEFSSLWWLIMGFST